MDPRAAPGSPATRRRDRWVTRVLAVPLGASTHEGVGMVLLQLGACTALTYWLGGVDQVPPHWFYLPIVFAGVRFGLGGAVVTALAAGLLSGPVMPADVATGVAQSSAEWIVRTFLFVLIGTTITLLIERSSGSVKDELAALELENAMHDGLEQRQFTVHYQPVVVVGADPHIVGLEALVRWEHPGHGLLSPAAFVPDAEANDMIVPIGAFVLETACRQVVEWNDERPDRPLTMAVNLSSRQLARPDVTEVIARVLRETGLDPSLLHLEVTESALVEDVAESTARLLELKALGVRIAVDDFGTGYSSLSYLRQLPVDVVKVDQEFVAGMAGDTEAATIVGAIVSLAHDLGKTTIAEGVEAADQLAALAAVGCDLAQGYLFSPPQPPDVVAGLLRADARHAVTRPAEGAPTGTPAGPQPSPVPLARWVSRELAGDVGTAAVQARALAVFFAAGAALSWAALLLPHPPEVTWWLSAAISGLGLPTALALFWVGDRLPNAAFHLLLAGGTVMITAGVVVSAGSDASITTSTYYVWVALYAAYFFSWRAAAAHVGLAGALYAGALLAVGLPAPASIWVIVMGTVFVAGTVTGWLSEQMRALAHTDVLTGLPNRLALAGLLGREIARAQRTGLPLCVAVVDLDHFKSVNDTHGHEMGDRVLAGVADRWRAALRGSDILARYGGDEFVVILPSCPVPEATSVLERLVLSSKPGASAGVSTWSAGDTPDRLLARADGALYEAKRLGRNRVMILPQLLDGAATAPTTP